MFLVHIGVKYVELTSRDWTASAGIQMEDMYCECTEVEIGEVCT
jgi:hypothetical protein